MAFLGRELHLGVGFQKQLGVVIVDILGYHDTGLFFLCIAMLLILENCFMSFVGPALPRYFEELIEPFPVQSRILFVHFHRQYLRRIHKLFQLFGPEAIVASECGNAARCTQACSCQYHDVSALSEMVSCFRGRNSHGTMTIVGPMFVKSTEVSP